MQPHIDEDVLDRYSVGSLSGNLLASVEEHVLACAACQTRLIETDQLLTVFRTAVTQIDARPEPLWSRFLHAGGLRWAGGLAVALALAVAPVLVRQGHQTPAIVLMQSPVMPA